MNTNIAHNNLYKEFFAISKYLCPKQNIDTDIANEYVLLNQARNIVLSAREQDLMNLCIKHNFLFSLSESGLKIAKPKSIFFQKIYFVAAILEATPDSYNFFIQDKNKNKFLSLIQFLFTGFWALCKTIIGYIFIKIYFIK